MFFKKKKEAHQSDVKERSTTGEFRVALNAVDESIEQKKAVQSSAQKLTQKLKETLPPGRKKQFA